MKKVIIALLCFSMATRLAQANILSIGPRIGVSIFQLKMHPPRGSTAYGNLQLQENWGYQLGLFARLDLFTIYIQPELLLTGSSARFSQDNEAFKLSFNKLDMPAMVGISFLGVFRMQLGPVFGLRFSTVEREKEVKGYYSHTSTHSALFSTVRWQGGLGIDIWNIMIDLKYEGSLSRFGNQIAGIDTEHEYALWILSIGFNIL